MHQPHDKLYREFFSYPKLIEELLRGFVDEQFVHDLDFSSLKKLNATYITDQFVKREADIVYEILYKDKPLYIYLLLELQSTVDQFMAERILSYICAFSREYCKTRNVTQFPPVFPLVLYNGDKKWDAPVHFQKLVSVSPLPSKYIPHFEFALVAINEIPKRKLLKLRNTLSALFYIESSEREEIANNLDILIDFIRNDLPGIYPKFLTWFFRVQDIQLNQEQINRVTRKSEVERMLRTKILEERKAILEEGIELGLKQGTKKGIEKGEVLGAEKKSIEFVERGVKNGLSDEMIHTLTDLDLKKIRSIRKRLENSTDKEDQ